MALAEGEQRCRDLENWGYGPPLTDEDVSTTSFPSISDLRQHSNFTIQMTESMFFSCRLSDLGSSAFPPSGLFFRGWSVVGDPPSLSGTHLPPTPRDALVHHNGSGRGRPLLRPLLCQSVLCPLSLIHPPPLPSFLDPHPAPLPFQVWSRSSTLRVALSLPSQ